MAAQRHEISSVHDETATLQEKLVRHREAAAGESADGAAAGRPSTPADAPPEFEWELLLKMGRGSITTSEYRTINDQLDAMTVEEFDVAFAELETLGIEDAQRWRIEQMLLRKLVQLDPRAALDRFGARADSNSQIAHLLAQGLKQWSETDFGAACAWVDAWAEGNPLYDKSLSGISDARVEFERVLVGATYDSRPEIARQRVLAMSADEAERFMDSLLFRGHTVRDQAAYAALARATLPEDKRARIFASKAAELSEDLETVSEYLRTIEAAGAEVSASVEATVLRRIERLGGEGDVTREQIDAARAWATAWDASDLERVTGRAIANAAKSRDLLFDDAAGLILHYAEWGGGDAVLQSFLTNGGCCFGDRSSELAGRISDPGIRSRVLRHIHNH